MTVTLRALTLVALVTLVGVLVACGGQEATPGLDPEPAPPTQLQEQAAPAEADAPSEGPDVAATEPDPPPAVEGPTLQDLLDAEPGEDVAIVWGTGDLEPGRVRVSFLIIEEDGELVQSPQAELLVGRIDIDGGGEVDAAQIPAVPAASSAATLEDIDASPHEHDGDPSEPHDHVDATDLYVAHLDIEEPGLYWALATPSDGGTQAFGTFEVRAQARAPSVGDLAVASETPTLDDAPAAELTTLEPPAEGLLRHSIASSLADGVPFVVTFATPAFCQTRVCGPVVETVEEARATYEERGIRFIQVEIYTDNDPNNGVNQWVEEWALPSEPWTFLVDAQGVIRERFEGAMSAGELAGAIDRTLS